MNSVYFSSQYNNNDLTLEHNTVSYEKILVISRKVAYMPKSFFFKVLAAKTASHL